MLPKRKRKEIKRQLLHLDLLLQQVITRSNNRFPGRLVQMEEQTQQFKGRVSARFNKLEQYHKIKAPNYHSHQLFHRIMSISKNNLLKSWLSLLSQLVPLNNNRILEDNPNKHNIKMQINSRLNLQRKEVKLKSNLMKS